MTRSSDRVSAFLNVFSLIFALPTRPGLPIGSATFRAKPVYSEHFSVPQLA